MNKSELITKISKIESVLAMLENSKPTLDSFRPFYDRSNDDQFQLMFDQQEIAIDYFYSFVKPEIESLFILKSELVNQYNLILADEILSKY